MNTFSNYLTAVADFVCGYPLFFILIGGGLYLFIRSGAVSLRRLPEAVRQLRQRDSSDGTAGQISSLQALCSVTAATIGMGNIAGVAIALVVGGPGAIFWMWVSALVGMCTKYHEGVLAIAYRRTLPDGSTRGGSMYIIENALGPRWRWLAVTFAVAGMFGTLCIMNANQLAEASVAIITPHSAGSWLSVAAQTVSMPQSTFIRLLVGITLALITALVVLGGIRRIARVASVMVDRKSVV